MSEETEVTMDDTLSSVMDDIESRDEHTEEIATPDPSPAPEEPKEAKPAVERARDDTGKFAKGKPAEKAPVPVKAEKASADPVDPIAPAQTPQQIGRPPSSWTPASKAKWANLDGEIRAEIQKREGDMQRGLQQYAHKAQFADSLYREIQPYEAMIRAEGGTPESAVRTLFNTAYLLRTASPERKQQLFQQLANQYGVNLSGMGQQAQAHVDPALHPVLQRVNQLESALHQQKEERRQQIAALEHQENTQANSAVEAFRANSENLYIDDVAPHMAALLEQGLAKDLQDAYDQACYARPDIRQGLLAKQQQEADAKRAQEAKQRASEARRVAGTNVSSSPSAPGGVPKKGMFDDLGDIYDKVNP